MYLDLEMDKKKPYKLMHCWEKLCDCPKWKRHVKDTAEGDERRLPTASAERPEMGVKACKATARAGKKPGASGAAGSIQESVKLYVAEVAAATVEKKKLQAKSDEKWKLYFKMQRTKLKNQEKKEERLFMATNTTGMSPNQKAYFVAERRRIQAENVEAEAAGLKESGGEGEEGDDDEEVEEEADA